MSIRIKEFLYTLIAIILMIASSAHANAEDYVDSYRFDIGVGLGTSGYLGDANDSNLLKNLGFSANAGARYLFDNRWAAKAQFSVATLSGSTADFENVLPNNAQYDFKSTVFDLSIKGEANFFSYGMGETYKRLRRWTPYLTVGVGMTLAATEGATTAAFSVPMGLGFKFKLSRRLNLNAEFTMTKVFGDKIDSEQLTDLYRIESSFLKNTDWFSTLTVGITYEFGPRCAVCNRID